MYTHARTCSVFWCEKAHSPSPVGSVQEDAEVLKRGQSCRGAQEVPQDGASAESLHPVLPHTVGALGHLLYVGLLRSTQLLPGMPLELPIPCLEVKALTVHKLQTTDLLQASV